MALKEKLTRDLHDALKSGLQERTAVSRFLLAQIHNREIEKRTSGQAAILTDSEVIEILQKEIKKRQEAIALFQKGGRTDLVEKEEKEITIINEYLPPSLTREELEKIISELKNRGFNDFGTLMKETMKKVSGRADGKLVSEIVKSKL